MHLYDYAASANCLKVRLLCGLLDLPWTRVPVDIFAGETLTDDFARLNPLRETPVAAFEDGTVLAQSNAILWRLAEGTRFLPASAAGRGAVVQWLFFEQERVMGGIGGARFRAITGRGDPALVEQRRVLGADALGVLDAHLGGTGFAVGDAPTIADISLYAYAHVAPEAGIPLGPYPTVLSWIAALEALPGFANDLEPYPPNAWPGRSRSVYD
jgi:glutathione S-transferase